MLFPARQRAGGAGQVRHPHCPLCSPIVPAMCGRGHPGVRAAPSNAKENGCKPDRQINRQITETDQTVRGLLLFLRQKCSDHLRCSPCCSCPGTGSSARAGPCATHPRVAHPDGRRQPEELHASCTQRCPLTQVPPEMTQSLTSHPNTRIFERQCNQRLFLMNLPWELEKPCVALSKPFRGQFLPLRPEKQVRLQWQEL